MKKIISVILAAVMLFALAGCGAEGLPEVDKTALEVLTEYGTACRRISTS